MGRVTSFVRGVYRRSGVMVLIVLVLLVAAVVGVLLYLNGRPVKKRLGSL